MASSIRLEERQASLAMKGAEAPIKAEGFNHLHINVRNLARSIRFYKGAFGLKVGFSAGQGPDLHGTGGDRALTGVAPSWTG
jgi:hypothetical protein